MAEVEVDETCVADVLKVVDGSAVVIVVIVRAVVVVVVEVVLGRSVVDVVDAVVTG